MLTYGVTYLANSGSAAAVVEKVDLAAPRGLSLVASYVVPITGRFDYGVSFGYPPMPHLAPGIEWQRATRAVATRIPPARGPHDHANLLVVIKPTRTLGAARAIDVFYREAGQQYHLQVHIRLVMLVGAKCPANWPQKYPA